MPARPANLIQIVAVAMLWALPRVAFATAEPGRDGMGNPTPRRALPQSPLMKMPVSFPFAAR